MTIASRSTLSYGYQSIKCTLQLSSEAGKQVACNNPTVDKEVSDLISGSCDADRARLLAA